MKTIIEIIIVPFTYLIAIYKIIRIIPIIIIGIINTLDAKFEAPKK